MIGTRGLPPSYGGVERAVAALADELASRGLRVTVYGRAGYCDRALHDWHGVRQISLPCIRTKHLEAISHTALATAHALASREFDLIHFHATGPALFASLARLAGKASVATVQGLDWRREKWGPVARTVLRLAARTAATVPNATIVVSRQLQHLLHVTYSVDATYIPNGVDLSDLGAADQSLEGLSSDGYVLFLGRIVPEKQVHLLIEAFARLDTDKLLVIAGPSSHSDRYVRYVEDLAAGDDRVRIVGPRYGAEKGWLLSNASVFVQPSTIEGLPIALLEALGVGARTIVSDIPENVEAITLGGVRFGHVFRSKDADDLRRAIQEVLEMPADATADAGERVRREYAWNRIATETEQVYRRALTKAC
ncbi:MAG: glycosyltransferase family 4 protein [Chloroflexia bacterium]|nr:glycosyltransferase family 4 protein [Chloroflexia bacterium]